jgi:hypothetical protein
MNDSVAPSKPDILAKEPESKNIVIEVTIPIITSIWNATVKTFLAPKKSPLVTRSDTSLEIAVGSPADEITKSHE